jgi:hypothetical protein
LVTFAAYLRRRHETEFYARQASILLGNNACRSGNDRSPTLKVFFALSRGRRGTQRALNSDIPSSGIFRVVVPNWLRACVSLGKTRNIKREARKAQWRVVRLESSRREMRICNSFRRPFLIAVPAATQMRVPLEALGFWANDNPLLLLPPS